jgi:hypothetical protein
VQIINFYGSQPIHHRDKSVKKNNSGITDIVEDVSPLTAKSNDKKPLFSKYQSVDKAEQQQA